MENILHQFIHNLFQIFAHHAFKFLIITKKKWQDFFYILQILFFLEVCDVILVVGFYRRQ